MTSSRFRVFAASCESHRATRCHLTNQAVVPHLHQAVVEVKIRTDQVDWQQRDVAGIDR